MNQKQDITAGISLCLGEIETWAFDCFGSVVEDFGGGGKSG